MDILVLGDGNFSFSLSLARRINAAWSNSSSPCKLVCTSFDELDGLEAKYSDVNATLVSLSKFHFVRVIHGLDATCLDILHGETFSTIIFNFPHLGYEDCRHHSCFLAHIMNSAQPLMLPQSSMLVIALAASQAKAWRMDDMAQRNKFEYVCERFLSLQEWPGYELKRHQSGKSFKTRVQDCKHYSFRLSSVEQPTAFIFDSVQTYFSSNANPSCSSQQQISPSNPAIAVSVDNTPKNRKRRKMDELTQGMYYEITGSSLPAHAGVKEDGPVGNWLCRACGKSFPTAQGARTHTYSVHVLGGTAPRGQSKGTSHGEKDWDDSRGENMPEDNVLFSVGKADMPVVATSSSSAVLYTGADFRESAVDITMSRHVCTQCGNRVFNSADALSQHVISKHGEYNRLLPNLGRSCH